jgi:hypothetical protein
MPRPCQRARLDSGLKLDINSLARRGFIRPGEATGPVGIRWTSSYFETEIAGGIITADMSGTDEGWVRFQAAQLDPENGCFRSHRGELDQRIMLVARPRHFGGRQWFFLCPYMRCLALVLWMPAGARRFACRQRWGRRVAYVSQFLDRDNRAHPRQVILNHRRRVHGTLRSR